MSLAPAECVASRSALGAAPLPFWHSRLWRKLAWAMAALGAAGPVAFGLVEMRAGIRDAHRQVGQLQQTQARDLAFAIESSLGMVRRQVQAVTALPWTVADQFTADMRRAEFGRLLRLLPVLESLNFIGADEALLVAVSRRHLDYMAGRDPGRDPPQVRSGQVALRDGYEPVLAHEIVQAEPKVSGRTVALINLRALASELRQPLQSAAGAAYVVDERSRVVLHQDPAVMMRGQLLSPLLRGTGEVAQTAVGLAGRGVLRSTVAIADSNWVVVVEQPSDVVEQPIRSTALRTALVSGAAVIAAMAAAATLAGRISRPVRSLHGAAQQLSAGRLQTRVTLDTDDELADLAHQFNRMAASLQANVAELEDKVAARTIALQRASQSKSDFLANMSHELRTPLNAILGFADVLREGMAGPMNDEQREFVADIHASGMHLLSLINDVLDLARIEAGQLQLEVAEFDVAETVDGALALVRQRCTLKGLKLQLSIGPEVSTWQADARRVKQMLVNLLANAVKFTPAGGHIELRVDVVSAGTATDGSSLCLQVKDTGTGIAPEDHGKIFREFVQVGSDAVGRAEGTGLGLALVRRLAIAHGGSITVDSALGMGATFTIELPARPPTPDLQAAHATPAAANEPRGPL